MMFITQHLKIFIKILLLKAEAFKRLFNNVIKSIIINNQTKEITGMTKAFTEAVTGITEAE